MTSLYDELEKKLQDSNATPMSLPLQFLKAITCDFSTEYELGRGGFGVVYKGVLQSGKIIAVKKLFEIHLVDDKTFQNEVGYLMDIKHQHVVQFIGYCAESSWETIKQPSGNFIWAEIPRRLLCFEYLCNKSLENYISVPTDKSSVLEWSMRYDIIRGICNGLNFLHDKCRMVHLDLKPENILMDATMTPKIGDFGLSRIFSNQQSRIFTNNSVGSRGYMAPEYLIQGIISTKADIFSLGVIMIEIITGCSEYPYLQLDSPHSTATSCQHFIENVLGSWSNNLESTSQYISREKYSLQLKECITIALRCVDPAMEKRPTAKDIIQVLNEVDQMEANKEMASEMESLILDTTVRKELISHITKNMSSIEIDGKMGDKKSQECFLPTPLRKSNTGIQNHQEAMKESSEPRQGIDETSELEAHGDMRPDMKCTDKLLVPNTTATKDLSPQTVTGEIFVYKTDGKVADKTSLGNPSFQEGAQASSDPKSSRDTTMETEVIPGSSALLDVHPLELRFCFEPNKPVACSLDLTNNTDEQVAFGLLKKSDEQTCFLSSLPMFGSVDPGTTYTLAVIMNKHENLPQKRTVDLILQANTYNGMPKQHFQNAEAFGNTVHRVTLKGVCALQGETIYESIPPSIKIISADNGALGCYIFAMDANQTEPLIITGNDSSVDIWNSDTQKSMGSIYISKKVSVWSVKFIARMGWFLAGTEDGFIHVCNYKKETQNIKSIRAHGSYFTPQGSYTPSLVIHPTQSYVLSACHTAIKLLDWDHRWKCIRTFKEHSGFVCALAFNPADYKSFASASNDHTIKVWSLDSSKSRYTLSGHSSCVNCVDFFTRDGQQYLITGSEDKTAKIWDMRNKRCVHTLPHRSEVYSVLPHPKLPVLVTGTTDGYVYLWSSVNFRLKRTIDIGSRKYVREFACLIDSGRVVVAHADRLSVIEISDEKEQGESSSNNVNSVSAAD